MSNTVKEVDESLDLLKETKSNIRSAIEQKGVTVSDTDTFASYATKIGEISSGSGDGLKNLSAEQRTQILLDGTYEGKDVEVGEVFTQYDGKFVEFNKTLNSSSEVESYDYFLTDLSYNKEEVNTAIANIPQPDLSEYIKNTATGTSSIGIGDSVSVTGTQTVAIGDQITTGARSVAIGSTAKTGFIATAVGPSTNASGSNSIALGFGANASKGGSIQLGNGTNSEEDSLYVYLGHQKDITGDGVSEWVGENYKLLDTAGKIPAERLPSDIEDVAVAGEGITFEEEREKNFEEYKAMSSAAGSFEYSEDGTRLLGVPRFGSLKIDKINPNENFTASFRVKIDTADSASKYLFSIDRSSNVQFTIRNMSGSNVTLFSLYAGSGPVYVYVPFESLKDYVDVFISFEHPTPTTVVLNAEVRDMSGNVLAKPSATPTEKDWATIRADDPVLIGNRSTGPATSWDLDLTNTWMEQNEIRYYVLKTYDEPRTRISVTDFDIIQKNKAKSLYSLILGSSEDDKTTAYRTGYNANRVENGGSAFGYYSIAEEYGSAIGYRSQASFGSAQIGEGYSEAFELGFGDHAVIDFQGKLYKDRLPITAGEGISFTDTSGDRYRLIGDATVEDGLLKFGKEKHNRSCLVSSWGGFYPQNYLEFQIALKDVPAGTSSYGGSDYLLRSYMIDDGIVDEDGTRHFRAPRLYYSDATNSGYTRIYYYGFFISGNISKDDFDSGDILIKETLIDSVATLQYSTNDGATWNTLATQTIEETQTAMGAWTMLLGQPENYNYVSTSDYTGSIDLNKSFLYLASNHESNLLIEGATRAANEIVVSATGREPVMPTLTADAETDLLVTGKYEGRDVAEGEVFTSAEGSFKKVSFASVSWSSTGLTGGTKYSVIPFKGAIWAIGNNDGRRSLDKGVTWDNSAGIALGHVAATNGDILVCSGNDANYMAWTEDGSSWTQAYIDTALQVKDTLLYGNGVFLCQGRDSNSDRRLIVSSDGKTWESVADPFSGADVVLKCFDGSRFIAVKYGAVWASENGKDWTQISSKMPYNDMYFFNGKYYAADNNSSKTVDVYSSTDLNTWTKVAAPVYPETGSYQVNMDVVGPFLFITVGYFALVSSDGVSWSLSNIEKSPWNRNLPSYAEGYFFVRYSADTSLGFNDTGLYRAESLQKSKVELTDTVALLDENGQIPAERLTNALDKCIKTSDRQEQLPVAQRKNAIAIGTGAMATGGADAWAPLAIGVNAVAGASATAIGSNCFADGGGTAIGANTSSTDATYAMGGATALGRKARAMASMSVQIGAGENTNANTLQFQNWQVIDAEGNIPAERLTSALSGYATTTYVDEQLGDINTILDNINGEVV